MKVRFMSWLWFIIMLPYSSEKIGLSINSIAGVDYFIILFTQ